MYSRISRLTNLPLVHEPRGFTLIRQGGITYVGGRVLKRAYQSIDTIPSNFSQWLEAEVRLYVPGRVRDIHETNHNVSSSVEGEERGSAMIGPLRYSSLPDKVTVIWINCPLYLVFRFDARIRPACSNELGNRRYTTEPRIRGVF